MERIASVLLCGQDDEHRLYFEETLKFAEQEVDGRVTIVRDDEDTNDGNARATFNSIVVL